MLFVEASKGERNFALMSSEHADLARCCVSIPVLAAAPMEESKICSFCKGLARCCVIVFGAASRRCSEAVSSMA